MADDREIRAGVPAGSVGKDKDLFASLDGDDRFLEKYVVGGDDGPQDGGPAGEASGGGGPSPDGSRRQDRISAGPEGSAARKERRLPDPPGSSPMFGFDGPEFGGGSSSSAAQAKGGAGEVDPKGIPVRSERKPRRQPPQGGKPVTVKGVPAEMIRAAKAMFPDARTQTDALVAYIAFNCPDLGSKADFKRMLTRDQYDLLRECKTNEQQALVAQLRSSAKKLDSVGGKIDFILAAMMFIMYSQCGLLQHYSQNPEDWDHIDLDGVDGGAFNMFFDVMSRNLQRYVTLRTEWNGRPAGM